MNRIILIGNGFDLAHDLETSYANFINWYWEYWGDRLLRGLKKMDTDGLCSFIIKDVHVPNWASVFQGWYYKRENPFIPWHLKEVIKLAKEDKDLCDFTMSPFLERICKSIETKKWVDIENEYYELLKKFALEDNNETKVEGLNQQLRTLQDRLVEYLSEVNKIEVKPIESIKSAISSPLKPLDISIEGQLALQQYFMRRSTHYRPENQHLPNRILLLNFNYTKTAELYSPKDKRTKFSINQIHGEVAKPESVIFGYGDEMDDKYKELVNKNDNLLLGNIKSIKYLETDNYRKMLEFIESDPYQVCIMGHSCGNSDRTLLNTLFEHRNCVSVKPYYHKKEDGTDNYLDLVQNISRNFNDMKLMRDRVVNKVYCKPLTEP